MRNNLYSHTFAPTNVWQYIMESKMMHLFKLKIRTMDAFSF